MLSSNALLAKEEQNVTTTCNAIGRPQPRITWSKAVGKLPEDRTEVINGTLTIYGVTKRDRGTYICKAENILGSATDTAQLMVFSRIQFKVRPPQELTPMIGTNVALPCVAASDLRTTISWTKVGKSSLPAESNVLLNGTLLIQKITKSHEGNYACRASNALTTIEAQVKINSLLNAPSCSVVRKYVNSASGNYVIDPDGAGGLAAFRVYCDMSDKNGVGVTVISHNSESRTLVSGYMYSSPGSYTRNIHYTGADLNQLASLSRISSHCEQFIKYECYGSRMFNGGYAWWVSRNSGKMTYWGGALPGSGKCACGMTNSCANPSYVCNCDINDQVWREDSGLLADKTRLPVKQLRFGDASGRQQSFGYSRRSTNQGYHTLGKFKCYGMI